jgi:hypothetical protein
VSVRNQHVEALGPLVDALRPYGWTDASFDGYLVALGDLPLEAVQRAVVEALRTESKMPAPADLRRSVLAHMVEEIPDADRAWNEVRRAFGTHGRSRVPEWSHPIIQDVVDALGGWGRLCMSSDVIGDRIQFGRVYDRTVARAEREALISPEFRALQLESGPVFRRLEAEELEP